MDNFDKITKLQEIKMTAQKLVASMEDNSVDMWLPNLKGTTPCIIVNRCKFAESPDDKTTEYSGITEEFTKLVELLK